MSRYLRRRFPPCTPAAFAAALTFLTLAVALAPPPAHASGQRLPRRPPVQPPRYDFFILPPNFLPAFLLDCEIAGTTQMSVVFDDFESGRSRTELVPLAQVRRIAPGFPIRFTASNRGVLLGGGNQEQFLLQTDGGAGILNEDGVSFWTIPAGLIATALNEAGMFAGSASSGTVWRAKIGRLPQTRALAGTPIGILPDGTVVLQGSRSGTLWLPDNVTRPLSGVPLAVSSEVIAGFVADGGTTRYAVWDFEGHLLSGYRAVAGSRAVAANNRGQILVQTAATVFQASIEGDLIDLNRATPGLPARISDGLGVNNLELILVRLQNNTYALLQPRREPDP